MRRSPLGASSASSGNELAVLVEEFLGLVALHPLLQQLQMLGLRRQFGKRHLVRAPGAFDGHAIHLLRAGPAFGRAQNDHGPVRPLLEAVGAGLCLDLSDLSAITWSSVPAMSWWTSSGSSPSTK